MKSVCVYCGSSYGAKPVYAEAARGFGRALVDAGISLVYGGGKVGLMGVIADEVMAAGGRAIGVIPELLVNKEVGHNGLTELHVVPDMHQRKKMMADLSDAFVAMPGGAGTFEELFEVYTWAQLGYHQKPVALLNIDGGRGRLHAPDLLRHPASGCRSGWAHRPTAGLPAAAERQVGR
jgi:uncharacterized protein (TIGR00730 family)